MAAYGATDLGSNHVKSVGRAARLLIALAEAGTEVSLTDLGLILDLPTSTVHRLASTLIAYRLIEQSSITGKYRLGLEALHLGNAVLQQLDFREEAKPSMERLAELTGETVNLSVLDGDEVVYIEQAEECSHGSDIEHRFIVQGLGRFCFPSWLWMRFGTFCVGPVCQL